MTQKLAIVERLPGHTEVMGGFASLALDLGYDVHLFFEGSDLFHMADYLRTRIPIKAENLHGWSEISELSSAFEVILLNTSYVWLDWAPMLQHWTAHNHLIVVHHHPEDIELNPFGASLYLTPVGGQEKWIFPLYSKPEGLKAESALLSLSDKTGLPTLVVIGSLEGKDLASVSAYMKAGGKLLHYDRHRCGYFSTDVDVYTQHVGLNGVDFMASLSQLQKPMFLWFPVVPESDYLVCRFTGALIIGVDLNCVMVMPERLRILYGFPHDAVITYESSVTEAECLEKLRAPAAEQQQRRRQLQTWAVDRWKKNLEVFAHAIDASQSTGASSTEAATSISWKRVSRQPGT